MKLEESLALYARGREAWNAWAIPLRAQRRQLLADDLWLETLDSRCDVYPANPETTNWLNETYAIFSYHTFEEPVDFRGFIFPGYAGFVSTKFKAPAQFGGAVFDRGVCFNYGEFSAHVDFTATQFVSRGDFDRTRFCGVACFDRAKFVGGPAQYDHSGSVGFRGAEFLDELSFRDVRVAGRALWDEARFKRRARFDRTECVDYLSMREAVFEGEARFESTAIPEAADFKDATFAIAPVFGRGPAAKFGWLRKWFRARE